MCDKVGLNVITDQQSQFDLLHCWTYLIFSACGEVKLAKHQMSFSCFVMDT